ncbi:hypothetical protein [uncultured Rikenella sp.]|uniref:hypothetical protein n=1 Tax=uncultured Rikenella sp. TaxID=368003 RepID=UPI00272960BC|nr:hypothetical protein [uncultured Rikenella sp.]
MKRILFYSIASLLLSGCSTTKRVHESQHATSAVTEQADLHAESRQTTKVVAHTQTESATAESEETRWIELEFDTTRPADSTTGMPPVKRITITDHHRNRENDTCQQTTDTLKQQTDAVLQDSTRRETHTETIVEQETEKESRPSTLPWLLVGVIFVALVWAAWKMWRG